MMIVRELREACRRLCQRPAYALLSVTVLGVGLGVVLFLFNLINALVLQPLPFPQPDRLVAVGEAHANGIGIGDIDANQYLTLREHLDGVAAMGAYVSLSAGLDKGHGATLYHGTMVSLSMLDMLAVKPMLGRGFSAADGDVGAARVMLIGEQLWRHAFHADPDVIGRKLRLGGRWTTVIGVLPASFGFRGGSQFWIPLPADGGGRDDLMLVARLQSGSTLARARAELAALDQHMARQSTRWRHEERMVMKPLADVMVHKDIRRWVWLMFAASALVLLLACVNVGNLQLVRTLNRRHELALRSALGCGRRRLFVGALMESLVLSAAALALALPIVHFGNRWLLLTYANVGRSLSSVMHLGLDAWVLGFAAALALLTTALAGMASAWRASRTDLQAALRDGGKGSGRGFARVARVLVVAEVALTVVLLVGAGTFVRALDALLNESSVGATHAAHVLTARVALPSVSYSSDAERIRFFDNVAAQMRQLQGVVAATASNTIPAAELGSHERVSRPGRPQPPDGWPWVQMGIVDAHFLATYDVRLLKGRFFESRDQLGSRPVIVIDQRMARTFWPHGNALHQQLVLYPGKDYARKVTVVGITESLVLGSRLGGSLPGIMMPLDQAAGQTPLAAVGVAVRTQVPAAAFTAELRKLVHAVDPQAAVYRVRSQALAMASNRVGLNVLTQVFAALGLVALLLAGAGLYGVLAFSVAQRTREIGIRRAIGAGHGLVVWTVGKQLAWQLGLGLGTGLLLAVPWSMLLADPSLRTQAHDPAVFVPVVLVVLGVAAVAALVPLLRALRVDPAVALRDQ